MAEKESSLGLDALYDFKRSEKITGHLDDEWEESQSSRKDSHKKTSRFSSLGHSGITDLHKRRDENDITKPSECNKSLEEGENRDLPLVSCNDKIITYQRRRKNKNVIEIYEDETDSDIDPDYVNFLSNLKEHGNANALEYESDGSPRLIVYEGECSSDDEGECSSDDERKDMEKAQSGEKDHKATIKTEVEINERFHVIPGSKNNQLRGKLTERSYEVRQGKRVGAHNRKKNVMFVEGDEEVSERVTIRVGAQNRKKNVRFVEGDGEASERVMILNGNVYLFQKNSRRINHVSGDHCASVDRCGKFTRAMKGKSVVHVNDSSNQNRKKNVRVVEGDEEASERVTILENNKYFYQKNSRNINRCGKLKRAVKGKKNNEEIDSDSETSTDVEILERAAFHKIFKRNRRNTN